MISKKTKKILALSITLTVAGTVMPVMNTQNVAFAEENFVEEGKIDSDNINNLPDGLENNDSKNSFKSKSIKTTGESVSLGSYGEIQNKVVKTTDAGVTLMMLDSWTSLNDFSNVDDKIVINDIEFKLNSDKSTVTVSKQTLKEDTDLDLPGTITCGGKDYTVTGIKSSVFYYCRYLTNVKIPKEIENIEVQVFSGCSKLTSIEVANDSANYTSENGILFSKDKKRIMCYPSGKEGEEYIIPEEVTSIDKYAFWECGQLTNIILHQDLEIIGDRAFYNCKGITNIYIPEKVTNIGYGIFESCSGLISIDVDSNSTNYASENGILFSKDKKKIVCYTMGKEEKEYIIPQEVTSIGNGAFKGCSKLTSIILPKNLESIGEGAFRGCSEITRINIPEGVTRIESIAFGECYNLSDITLPKKLESIGMHSFYGCYKLKSINLPNKVTRIDDYAFYHSGLTEIGLPEGVTYIGDKAFLDCSDLKIIIVHKDLSDANINNIKDDVPCIIKYEEDTANMKISDILFDNSDTDTKLIIPSKIYDKQVIVIGIDALEVIKNNADKTIVENKDMLELLKGSNFGIDIDKVTVKSNKEELKKFYDDCVNANYNENNYTADTYTVYNTAMDEAETVLNNRHSEQAEIDAALKKLKDAVNGLQLKPVSNKYTVTFNSNGGSEIAPIENVEEGTTIILPTAPTKSGYTFEGWYTDVACSEGNKFTISTLVNADMTVYAKWTKKSSSSSSSSKKERPLLKNEDGNISNIVLNKDRYSNEIIGTILSHIGLSVNNVDSLYKINTDAFKGNLATFDQIVVEEDGKETSLSYIYVKCEKAGISTLKVDVYSLKDKYDLYVYNTDELGNVKLVKVVSQDKIKDNDNFIDINVEDGQNYIVSEIKLQEKNVATELTSDNGWKQVQEKWTYIKDGKTAIGWIKDTDGKWYNIDSNGFMKTGWHKDSDGKWYSLSQNGAMRTGWFRDNNEKWYLLNNSGAMVTGWIQNGNKWYYLNYDGSMAVDTTVNGYYVNKSGEWE